MCSFTTMNKSYWIVITIIVSISLVMLGIFVWILFGSSPSVPSSPPNLEHFPEVPPVLPPGGSTATSTGIGDNPISVLAWDGSDITVRDFKNDPDTVVSENNPGYYFIAGGVDIGIDDLYDIFYLEKHRSFTIVLLKEPLKETRLQAEQELMRKLGIDWIGMCRLRYHVGVPNDVNPIYSGTNLGFSFCPGAVVLP